MQTFSLRNLFRFCALYSCQVFVLGDFETDLKYIRICNRTSPITMRLMNEVLINKKLPTATASSAALDNFKCFLHCLFAQYGWMDEEGGFELHVIHHMLTETGSIQAPVMNFIMYHCTAQESLDKCERAFKFIECFWDKTSEENNDEDKFFYTLDEQDNNMLIR